MKKIFFIITAFFLLTFTSANADTKQAETGSVAATVSKNLTEELRKGKEKVQSES